MNLSLPSRRQFLQSTLAASTLAAIAPAAYAANSPSTNLAPNGKLNMGIIGCGGRGNSNMRGVSSQNIYAICDVNPAAIASAKKQFPNAIIFHDWRKLIQDPNIHAVTISTADHHHAIAAISAMRAGKHVYCEKPARTHSTRSAMDARRIPKKKRHHRNTNGNPNPRRKQLPQNSRTHQSRSHRQNKRMPRLVQQINLKRQNTKPTKTKQQRKLPMGCMARPSTKQRIQPSILERRKPKLEPKMGIWKRRTRRHGITPHRPSILGTRP